MNIWYRLLLTAQQAKQIRSLTEGEIVATAQPERLKLNGLGERIPARRKDQGLTPRAVGARVDLSASFLCWKAGS